jgi:hypothetical protein
MMPVGVTIATTAACGLFIAGLGFMAGRLSAPDEVEQMTELVAAQTSQLDAIAAAQAQTLEAASRPVVIDAEIRDKLSEVPPQCRGGIPVDSLACAWSTCVQYGQSSANRPECGPIRDAYLASMACPATERPAQ